MQNKQSLRRQFRTRRLQLTQKQQQQAAFDLLHNFAKQSFLIHNKRFAVYFPNNAEIDPMPLAAFCNSRGKKLYLPVVSPLHFDQLWFAPYAIGDELTINRFGIPEPNINLKNMLRARDMDVLCVPLLAVDENGNRLGYGGGFYDRSLRFLVNRKVWFRPKLIGLAYDFQVVDNLPRDPWDIPLNYIITEKRIIRCN